MYIAFLWWWNGERSDSKGCKRVWCNLEFWVRRREREIFTRDLTINLMAKWMLQSLAGKMTSYLANFVHHRGLLVWGDGFWWVEIATSQRATMNVFNGHLPIYTHTKPSTLSTLHSFSMANAMLSFWCEIERERESARNDYILSGWVSRC